MYVKTVEAAYFCSARKAMKSAKVFIKRGKTGP